MQKRANITRKEKKYNTFLYLVIRLQRNNVMMKKQYEYEN